MTWAGPALSGRRIGCWRPYAVMRHCRPVDRAAAGRVLARLGDPRVEVLDPLRIEWCEIPAGPFVMGDGDKAYEHDIPYDYRISRYPITVAQFEAFVADGGYAQQRYWPEAMAADFWSDAGFRGRYDDEPRRRPADYGEPFDLANHPAVGVTWYECLAFTRWLAEKMWKEGRLAKVQTIALPSEPEWEKAARGSDGRAYPWGAELTANHTNYDDTGIGSTSAVGCFPLGTSPYGAEEMAGTVWEWTRSVYADYPYMADDGRELLRAGEREVRVLRGGSFDDGAVGVRCAARCRDFPNVQALELRVSGCGRPHTSGL